MFISVDLPAPFSPSRACTSLWRRSKSTLSFARTPGKRLVIPRSSRRGASAIRAILTGRGAAARQSLCRRTCTRRGRDRNPRVETPDPDGSARRAEHEVLAAVVQAVHGVADGDLRRDGGQLEVGETQRGQVLLVRGGGGRVGADATVRHHDRRATAEADECGLLATGGDRTRPL